VLALAGPEQVRGIAWWAHVGGFAAGMVLHPLFVRRRRAVRPLQPDEYGREAAWM
jgi:membrane associated rhomboid family serine protease